MTIGGHEKWILIQVVTETISRDQFLGFVAWIEINETQNYSTNTLVANKKSVFYSDLNNSKANPSKCLPYITIPFSSSKFR